MIFLLILFILATGLGFSKMNAAIVNLPIYFWAGFSKFEFWEMLVKAGERSSVQNENT